MKQKSIVSGQQLPSLQQSLLQTITPKLLGVSPLQELSLQYSESNFEDKNQLRLILSQYLAYPSTEIAELHRRANRLGRLDLENEEPRNFEQFNQVFATNQICPCCGLIQQKQRLGTCTDIGAIRNIGVSTQLFFMTVKNIILLLSILLFVYVIYSIVSNIIASNNYKQSITQSLTNLSLQSYQSFLIISLGSKQLHETQADKISYTVQCWLAFGVVVIWAFLFAGIKYLQRSKSVGINRQTRTAADFSVLIKNLPVRIQRQQLTDQFRQYFRVQSQNGWKIQFNIDQMEVMKINKAVPFYLQKSSFRDAQLEKINQKFESIQQKFISWILQRRKSPQFTVSSQSRHQLYKQFSSLKKQRKQRYIDIGEKIREEMKKQQNLQIVPAFVTFDCNRVKQSLVSMHDGQDSILSKLCKKGQQQYFYFKDSNGNLVDSAQIRQAPEPEDIIWTNLGQDSWTYFSKRFITYSITIIVLGASFGISCGLSKAQSDYVKSNNTGTVQYISFLISLIISIVNIIIKQILRYLTKIQRNWTYTRYQIGLGIKAVLASIINSILIPILVNYFFKENLYGVNGLAYDIFYLGITNSFLNPLLSLFDPYYLYTLGLKSYKNKPTNKLPLNQNQLNAINEYLEFEIGYQYIYVINLFLFACFFAPLQPIIVAFSICGLTMMYWVEKYVLFRRCRRPVPGNNSVNTAMYQLIYLGPIFLAIGSFCWSHFFKQNFIGLAPNLASAILGLVVFLIPYKKIIKKCCKYQKQQFRDYRKQKLFLPSEYDRLNPSTSQASITQYRKQIQQKMLQLQQKPEQISYFSNEMLKLFGVGGNNRRYEPVLPIAGQILHNGNGFGSNRIIFEEMFGSANNAVNPFLLLNAMVPAGNKVGVSNTSIKDNINNKQNRNRGQFGMAVQNWFTQQETKLASTKNLQQNNENALNTEVGLIKMTDSLYNNTVNNKNGPVSDYQNLNNENHNYANQIPLNMQINLFGNLLSCSNNMDNFGNKWNANVNENREVYQNNENNRLPRTTSGQNLINPITLINSNEPGNQNRQMNTQGMGFLINNMLPQNNQNYNTRDFMDPYGNNYNINNHYYGY